MVFCLLFGLIFKVSGIITERSNNDDSKEDKDKRKKKRDKKKNKDKAANNLVLCIKKRTLKARTVYSFVEKILVLILLCFFGNYNTANLEQEDKAFYNIFFPFKPP